MSDTRGEKVMHVTREALRMALLRDSPARRVDLPDDVEIGELWHADDGTGYMLRISSEAFDVTDEGEPLEQINPAIHAAKAVGDE